MRDVDLALQVTILRREKLVLAFSTAALRERVFSELNECVEFASAGKHLPCPVFFFKLELTSVKPVHAASKHPLPPMPTLNGIPKPQLASGDGIPSSHTAPELRQSNGPPTASRSPSPHRVSSPIGNLSSPASRHGSGPPSRNSHESTPVSPMSLTSSMSNRVHSLEAQIQQGGGGTQPVHDRHTSPTYPVHRPSQAEGLNNNVGQPQFVGGPPPGFASTSQSSSPQPVAPVPRVGPLPGQVIGPGQLFPSQRSASADPLSRRGPLGLAHTQQPMHGIDSSSGQRGPPHLSPNHANGQFAATNPPYVVPPVPGSSAPSFQGGLRKSPSASPLNPQREPPPFDGGPRQRKISSPNLLLPHANSFGSMGEPQPRLLPPSAQFRAPSMVVDSIDAPSPPTSPTTDVPTGPVTSTISAQMKCKVFLKQAHAQWKSLGSSKLKLYREQPTNVKQLVVEAEDKNRSVLISTIVLTDGVERVGKTGIAVELSDNGARTGIVYMIQLRNEQAAVGLYEGLLAGSDRTTARQT